MWCESAEEICGVNQLCVVIPSGVKGAVHALNELFDEKHQYQWGVLMVDAANAFNS